MILESINHIIEDKSNIYSAKTLAQYEFVMKLCQEVGEQDDMHKFANNLLSHMASKNISNSSAKTYLKKVISALNYSSVPHNINTGKLFRGVKDEKSEHRVFLNFEELKRMERFKPSRNNLKIVRDLFLFCSYTGMRHSEVMSVTSDNVLMRDDGIITVRYTTHKTGKTNEVPLNNTCLKIVKRYKGGERLLPTMSDSKCNKYIHELLQEMKYNETQVKVHYVGSKRVEQVLPKWKLITFHTSRHNYISNLINNGLSVQQVSDLAGVSIATLVEHYSHSEKNNRINKALEILNR